MLINSMSSPTRRRPGPPPARWVGSAPGAAGGRWRERWRVSGYVGREGRPAPAVGASPTAPVPPVGPRGKDQDDVDRTPTPLARRRLRRTGPTVPASTRVLRGGLVRPARGDRPGQAQPGPPSGRPGPAGAVLPPTVGCRRLRPRRPPLRGGPRPGAHVHGRRHPAERGGAPALRRLPGGVGRRRAPRAAAHPHVGWDHR